ncbi:hypothetical protein RND81_01G094000 [Saponaria officinalis]|uniref:Uncharacterized protein n=1 Tax=Saponaria officinalis TaxID=3572 RepID=A0AAW1NDB4_SAPOF
MICRTSLRITTSSSNLLRTLTRSTSSAAAAAVPTPRSEPDSDVGGSIAYQNSRKLARPATVTWCERLRNSVNLIGTVEYPVKQYATNGGKVGAHTVLLVKPSPDSPRHFRVTLCMWDLLAERALEHLKQNDYIYVSGELGSYTKSTLEGAERMYYRVTAKELNYVQVPDENYLVAAKSGSDTVRYLEIADLHTSKHLINWLRVALAELSLEGLNLAEVLKLRSRM